MSAKQDIETDVFVISDLHIGGQYAGNGEGRGFRINTHIDVLTNFIDELRLRAQNTERYTELVINGDFVDFLAEETLGDTRWQAFISDQEEAIEAFKAITNRDKAFFDALRSALQAGVSLILLLGNHDVELSLPAVRAHLLKTLDIRNGAQFRFIYDGEAYVIGDALIEHGNRYDGFNVIDHDRLRRHRSAKSRQLTLRENAKFHPPPGSQLVELVMNPIKKDYGFIDLLKPETEAVVPLLIALEPGFTRDIERIWNLYRLSDLAKQHAPSAPAWPARASDIRAVGGVGADESKVSELQGLLAKHMGENELGRLLKLMRQVNEESTEAAQRISFRDDARYAWSLLKVATTGDWERRRQVLLDALRVLQNDTSFERSIETDQYLVHAKKLAAAGFRVIVFGHTHLAKEVVLENGAPYLNTGTWADLMCVPNEILNAPTDFALSHLDRFVDALRTGKFYRYVNFLPTYAHIQLNQHGQTVSAKIKDYAIGVVCKI